MFSYFQYNFFLSTCFISFWEKTLKYPNITWIFSIPPFIPIRFWFMYYTTLLFGSNILKIATCFCGLILLSLSNISLNLIFFFTLRSTLSDINMYFIWDLLLLMDDFIKDVSLCIFPSFYLQLIHVTAENLMYVL